MRSDFPFFFTDCTLIMVLMNSSVKLSPTGLRVQDVLLTKRPVWSRPTAEQLLPIDNIWR